jgi:hypothetical protein
MKQILLAGSADRLASICHGYSTNLAPWFVVYAITADTQYLTRLPPVMVIEKRFDLYFLPT